MSKYWNITSTNQVVNLRKCFIKFNKLPFHNRMVQISPVLKIHPSIFLLIVITMFTGLFSCYSFKGISIAPDVNTFYVATFQNSAPNAPADIAERFSELLIQKINSDSKLNYNETGPDIEFEGSVRTFNVRAVAPQAGATTAFNRLEIGVMVDFTNYKNEDENWTQNFSFFKDFESTQNLSDVQEELIVDIFDQLMEDVFNRAFTNW